MTKVTILIDGDTGRVLGQKPPVVIPDILNRGSSVFYLFPRTQATPHTTRLDSRLQTVGMTDSGCQ